MDGGSNIGLSVSIASTVEKSVGKINITTYKLIMGLSLAILCLDVAGRKNPKKLGTIYGA